MKPYKWQFALSILGNMLLGFYGAMTMAIIQPVLSVLFDEQQQSIPAVASKLSAFKEMLFSLMRGWLIDPDKFQTLLNLSLFIITVFVTKNVIKYLTNVLNVRLGESVVRDMRYDAFSKLMSHSMGYFTKRKTGELITLVTGEVSTMHGTVIPFIMMLFKNPVEILLLLVILLSLSWKLTLIAFSTSIITLGFISVATKYLRKYAGRMAAATANYVSTLQEGISGVRIVKAFNAEGTVSQRFWNHSTDYVRSSVKMSSVNELVPSINEIFAIAALCVVLFVGGGMVFSEPKQMSGAELMTFLFALFAIMSPIAALTNIPGNIQRGLVASNIVFDMIDSVPVVQDGNDEVTGFAHELSVENLSFGYNDSSLVLNDVSLRIQRGKKVALVGTSGSGKSTLVDLLIRFYDPLQGRITIDGVDIRNFTTESYRSRFGIVSQESILFNDTIAANIAFGMESVSHADIREAARIAHADQFIENLPNEYDTYIGDRGVMLSGGQRQRIAIARAVVRNPDILIFDEATSALDTTSEKIVQQAINEVLKSRTAIIIAHRLSTIIDCDTIVVFDNGRIAEQGTHAELLSIEGGIYKRLYDVQFASVDTGVAQDEQRTMNEHKIEK
ncbi:MAG: ABC transporter ATP-binding protein [Candidatus Kapabacteria bacterium]|nr:ABC transporter ATP-binding protein [Candidatus Kapabacteria bacterium]